MPTDFAVIRHELLVLARRKASRINVTMPGRPCRWRPDLVRHPESGQQFTTKSAWEFIVDLLESGHSMDEIELRKPPGRKGYVMQFSAKDTPSIYVKLQLGDGKIIGRSFHNSTFEVEANDE